MRRIVYSRPDGGVSVVLPVINTRGEPKGFTEADAEHRAWDAMPADAIAPRWVEGEDLPDDRTFRDAWTHDLTIDMAKARKITKTRLRDERRELLIANDIAVKAALLSGANTKELAAERQRLLDITKLADAASSSDELKKLTVEK